MNRKQLVVGNWKMNGSLSDNEALLDGLAVADGLSELDISVCVPYPYLAQARERLAAGIISWGAQNVSEHDAGAYTGEISGSMLADFEISFGLVGHSERRSFYADDNELVVGEEDEPEHKVVAVRVKVVAVRVRDIPAAGFQVISKVGGGLRSPWGQRT